MPCYFPVPCRAPPPPAARPPLTVATPLTLTPPSLHRSVLLYFPLDGGMLLPAGLGYDPQLIKPPSNYRGSDQMDYAAAMAAAGIVVKGKRPEFLDKIASLSEPPPPDAKALDATSEPPPAPETSMAAAPETSAAAPAAPPAAAPAAPPPERDESRMSEEDKLDELRLIAPGLSTSELRSALVTAGHSMKFAVKMLAVHHARTRVPDMV